MRIVYFDLDCVRKDHLGVYGYARNTSPHIDQLAAESALFNNCFVSDAPCLPSRAALFSARPGISNGVISHEHPGCEFRFPGKEGMPNYYPEYTMPMRAFQENGYHTVTFSIFQQRHMAWWFNAGFSEVHNPTAPSAHENAEDVNPRVIRWIENNIADHDDLFLHVHYWDAHTPYHPAEDMLAQVRDGSLPDFPDEATIHDHFENFYGPKSARDIMIRQPHHDYKSPFPAMPDHISNRDEFKHMLDSYDASIAAVDRAIGEIINALKAADAYEDTVIIISADHGEAIGQMGMYFEHGVAVDGVTNVPLIVRMPGVTDTGHQSDALIYQYDLIATLFDYLKLGQPERWDAQSFLPALSGEPFEGRPFVVYGCGIFSLQRAIRTRTHALVWTYHPGCSPLDDRYLFDIENDPNQTTNIIADESQVVQALESLFMSWWQSWCMGPDAVVDPFVPQTPVFSYFPVEAMRHRLEFLGRQDQLADLDDRLQHHRRNKPQAPLAGSQF
ncbi:MAG: arylsulfatase [Anaerolineaceae bacterium]|nr:arylsulfatase [Anaerolineaceae bacterium]